MTPAARTQAAIELLDAIIAAARDDGPAADTLIARYFAQRRYAGSKDRRAVRELVYAAIRLHGERPASGRAAVLALAQGDASLRATFDDSPHAPAPIGSGEAVARPGLAPAWLLDRLRASGLDELELAALVERAPLDVRVNRLCDGVPVDLGNPISGLPDGRRLPAGTDLAPYAGRVEVQDAGSQIVTLAAAAEPGQRVVDLCAGAGGKTLALAAQMANEGLILACDTDRGAPATAAPARRCGRCDHRRDAAPQPRPRARSAGRLACAADTVLIDAPCSGPGTWRRSPEARWRLTPDRLARLALTQSRLLDIGAALVRPGGALVYVVCSLLDEEGAEQAAGFAARSGWRADDLSLPRGPIARTRPPAHAGARRDRRLFCRAPDGPVLGSAVVPRLELMMRVLPFAIASALTLASLSTSLQGQRPPAPVNAQSLQLLTQGKAARAAGDLDGAVDLLETSIAVDPRNLGSVRCSRRTG
jgi:16S rRNA (cytosine967-C5)-methyltransferase